MSKTLCCSAGQRGWDVALLWDPRDLWMGVFWDYPRATDRYEVYICLIPCLPVRIRIGATWIATHWWSPFRRRRIEWMPWRFQGASYEWAIAARGQADEMDLPYFRADGETPCPCGKPYRRHRQHSRLEWLNVLCDGSLVKL